MLPQEQIEEIRSELESSANPLFFFHDDADGLCSFLLLYRYCKEGNGMTVKSTPQITTEYLTKVVEFSPDKIFILDIAIVDQEFIDKAKVPIIWIDHHEPLKRHGLKYYNPRLSNQNDNLPVTCICYEIVKQDLWIATIGAIGDWHLPSFAEQFSKEHPKLLSPSINNPDDAIFKSAIGELVDVFSFILKGRTSEVKRHIKQLTRIKSPEEILSQETEDGKEIYQKYRKVKNEYDVLLSRAEKETGNGKMLVFTYQHESSSFTKNLANALLFKHPDKAIIIGREKDGRLNISLRSRKYPILPILKKALQGIDGSGGGHEFACGAHVRKEDFEKFLGAIKEELPE